MSASGTLVRRRDGAPSPRPVTRRRGRLGPGVWAARATLLAAFLIAWQLSGSTATGTLLVSTPAEVLARVVREFAVGDWWAALGATLQEASLGFALGVVAAVVVVAVIVPSPLLARFVAPFIAAANALPLVVLAPMFIVWFGISLASKVYFVATAIFFIIFHGLYTGIRSIDPGLLDNARALGAGALDLIRQVYVPAVVTWIVAGLRLSAAWSLLAAVVAEYLGSNRGIGYEIAAAQQQLDASGVIAGILVVAVVAVTLDRVLVRLETRFTQWRVF